MSTLNSSIVNIANPVLASEFGISMAQVQWVSTIYLIVASSSMLLLGRLGDRIGAHKIYIVGVGVLTLGSLFCALAPNLIALLLARALQGLGGAFMLATSIGLLTTIFPLAQRGRAMGISVLMVGLGNVAGPSVGGFVLAHATWPFIFLLSVPFGVIAFIMAAIWLRSPVPKNPHSILDVKGSIVFTGIVTCLIICISGGFEGQQWFGVAVLALMLVFYLVERRAQAPLFDIELLSNRRFALGNLITFFSYAATMMLMFQLPFFLDTVWNIPVSTVGLWLMVNALALAVAGLVAGFISDKYGAMKVMPSAIVLLIVCVVLALILGSDENLPLFMAMLVLSGVGSGLLNTPNNSDIMTAAGKEKASYASGFVATNRNLAFCIGTAFSASVFHVGQEISARFTSLPGAATGDVALEHLFAFKVVLIVCLILVILSFVACLILKYGKAAKEQMSPEQQKR